MLHKVPKLLAVTSSLFVVGVLAYTASIRFGEDTVEGQLVTSSMSSMPGTNDGPWMDPNNNMAIVDLESFVFTSSPQGAGSETTGGGDTATTAGTTAGAPPPADACAPKAEKTLSGKEVCKCGKSADDLQAAYKTTMEKALNNVKAPACAAECPQDDSIDPNPKNTVNGPKITRTHVAGKGVKPNEDKKWKAAKCKSGQLVACFKATGDATSERFCKKKSSSSSSPPSSSSSSRTSSSSTSPSSTSSSTTSSSTTSSSRSSSSTPSTTSSSSSM